jgi:predicted NUDIX family NTP pyrophosphohydrolase
MATKHSYGIVLYRTNKHGKTEIFLCKANSIRYWQSLRTKIWGIPKGRAEEGESPLQTAMREFHEETGNTAPDLDYTNLCDFQTPHNKVITVFIADATGIKGLKFRGSNTHEAEFPPGSGTMVVYPEIATARWFTFSKAANVLMWGQKDMLREIKAYVKSHKVTAHV